MEAHRAANRKASFDELVEADKRSTANKQDVRRVNLGKFLVRMFPSALRGNIGDGAFQHFEECLLYSFAGYVSRDRGVLVFPADLVDLIDVDDSRLCALDVTAGVLD